jgi:hypothetical protein
MPTAEPIAIDTMTKASQPKIAVFRCRALQRPARAANVLACMAQLSRGRPEAAMRGPGVRLWG